MKHLGQITKALLCVGILFFQLPFVNTASAQKYAVVNTDYVLKSLPDYNAAQKRLDRYVTDWTAEMAEKQGELESMRADYEQESYLLPESLKKRRQEEIRAKEKEIRDLQQQHFGAGGDLDKRRAELLRPVQDRVYSAIERIAQEKNYAFVFDKAGSATVLFASKKYDISDDVLELLGVKPGGGSADDPGASEPKKKPVNPEMRPPGRDPKDSMPLKGAK